MSVAPELPAHTGAAAIYSLSLILLVCCVTLRRHASRFSRALHHHWPRADRSCKTVISTVNCFWAIRRSFVEAVLNSSVCLREADCSTNQRNFVTCYKDPAFLDFFYTRLRPLADSSVATKLDADTRSSLDKQGYSFISLCGKERNYVRSQDTPIVFKALVKEDNAWQLAYAGSLKTSFLPQALKVDQRGYLYHPSPEPPASRRTRAVHVNPYGQYSLLKSELVLSQLSAGLTVDEKTSEGSFEWLGEMVDISPLAEGEALLGRGYPDDKP